MAFNTGLTKEQLDNLSGNLRQSDRTTLPFTAPQLWWKNGDSRLETLATTPSAVLYFGGWGCDAEEMTAAGEEYNGVPRGFSLVENVMGGGGGRYSAYFSRVALVAPILRRSRWFPNKDAQGNLVYHPDGKIKSTSKVQYLVLLGQPGAEKNSKPEYWGMAVISASSNSGIALDNAIQEWGKQTASLRLKHAEGTPPQFFWAPLGTFGATPVVELKGKGQNKSPINPCQVFLPPADKVKDWGAFFERSFIGEDLASIMVDAADNAREWADEWNKHRDTAPAAETSTAPQGNTRPAPQAVQEDDSEFPF